MIDPLEAADRIRQALVGLPPKNWTAQTDERPDGTPVMTEYTPIAKVKAGDSRELCDLIPPEKRTEVVKMLRYGTRPPMPPGRVVMQQTQDLHHLLAEVKPYMPEPKAPEPEPTPEPELIEESRFEAAPGTEA